MDKDVIEKIISFREQRNWKQFHNPKDLAISISLEAAELLEVFQWSGKETGVSDKKPQAIDELADILIYCVLMADALDVDIDSIILNKLEKNRVKYDAEKSYGNNKKYTEME